MGFGGGGWVDDCRGEGTDPKVSVLQGGWVKGLMCWITG